MKMGNIAKSSPFILILILGLAVPLPTSAGWSATSNLTNDGNGNAYPSIAQMRNDDVWVVWQKPTGYQLTNDLWSIVYNSSTGTWPPQGTRLGACSTYYGKEEYPFTIQTSDGAVWILWQTKDRYSNNYDIVSKKSFDYGETWGSFNNVTNDYTQPNGKNDIRPSALQASNGTIWVVWQKAFNATITQIYYRTAPATGSPWSPERQLTNPSRIDQSPSILQAKNGSIIVFWSADIYGADTPEEIMYQVYNGVNWGPERKLTNDGSNGLYDLEPSAILTRTGTILVVWDQSNDENENNIVYASSKDNGNTWSTTTPITTDDANSSPSATQGNDKRIWIAYTHEDSTGQAFDVYFKTSDPLIIEDDLTSMSSAFGSTRAQPRWDYGSDLDGNGIIDAKDLYVLSRNYGKDL
jgi:hypothetical protein